MENTEQLSLILDMVKAQSLVSHEEEMTMLKQHSNWRVRKMVAENPKTPLHLLHDMTKDRSKRVSEAAVKALSNRK